MKNKDKNIKSFIEYELLLEPILFPLFKEQCFTPVYCVESPHNGRIYWEDSKKPI